MINLYAFVIKSKDKSVKDMVMASSLECNISAIEKNPIEAAKKLACLLEDHFRVSKELGVSPYITNGESLEAFGGYCARTGKKPSELRMKKIPMRHGFVLNAYDLTK